MKALRCLTLPFLDVMRGLERCLTAPEPTGGLRRLSFVGLGLAVGWWIYVPVHELLHALGCLATGGSVSRLEIATVYGGGILARLVPFVEAGGEYAGRLSGFDTGGSDPVYLATVFAPYALTVWPGVWALRTSGRRGRAFAFGLAIPVALAPFVALPGDAYEIGSILTTRLPPWSEEAEVLRRDDLVLLISELGGRSEAPWGGAAVGTLFGVVWAYVTYTLGSLVSSGLEKRASRSRASSSGNAACSDGAPGARPRFPPP